MAQIVNIAVQALPRSSSRDEYEIVDEVIKLIEASGIKYKVCPFETVMEGEYQELMGIVMKIHEQCFKHGAESLLMNLKIQISKDKDVFIEDKIGKYE